MSDEVCARCGKPDPHGDYFGGLCDRCDDALALERVFELEMAVRGLLAAVDVDALRKSAEHQFARLERALAAVDLAPQKDLMSGTQMMPVEEHDDGRDDEEQR